MKQMFFWNSLAFPMIQWMLAIWSLVPLPFLNPAWTSGSSQLTYCWSLAWRILSITLLTWASLVAKLVKNPPAMQETWVWSLDWEDPLENGKATHFSILAWRIPWTVQAMESQRVGHDWATFAFSFLLFLWSNRHWQFDLWFLCLFKIQLEHLKIHSSCTFDA